jgi:hypothetical protein
MKTHEWEKKGSLEVRLSRRLSSLKKAGYVNRDEKGHKLVYYSLTKPTLKRMKLKDSKLKEFIEDYYPLLSMDTYTFTNQTPISNLKYYLSVIPPILFEMLNECVKEGFPNEAELKQMNSVVIEHLAKILVSLQEELREKFEHGENLKNVLKDVEKWVYQKYSLEE